MQDGVSAPPRRFPDLLENTPRSLKAHRTQRLAYGGHRWCRHFCRQHIVKADNGTVLRDAYAGFCEPADYAECGHVIEAENGGEWKPCIEHRFCYALAADRPGS
jgi:hypothetical protein